ncbi:MAG TPA: Uma2 family endonuclease [Verrucomicrobiales bacterium]|nr:Uma2 family endonuclease [Verrucomicrobiales bacterium]
MTTAGSKQAAGISIPAGLSYEEFLDWLDEDVRAEWIHGEIIVMSPASRAHQEVLKALAMLVGGYVEEKALGKVYLPPFNLKPGPGLPGREPDFMFVSERHQGRLRNTFIDGPSDLVVEIISPESRTRDTIDKFREYEQGGIPEYWIVEPYQQSVQFFQLDETGRYREVLAVAGVYRSRVIEEFWLRTDWLWTLPKISVVFREWGLL